MTNLPSQGDPQLLSRWSDCNCRGASRYRSGVGLIAGSTARVRRTSASALTATMFPAIEVGYRQRAARNHRRASWSAQRPRSTVTVTNTVPLLQA